MGNDNNKEAVPAQQPHPVDLLMRRAKGGEYSMKLIKDQVDAMETTDLSLLRNQLDVELTILRRNAAPEDTALVMRLNDLEDHLKEAEKSFGTKTQETIGAGLNAAIDSVGSGAKKGVEIVGDQVRKGTDAVVQIGAQVADVLADPNRSQKEKIIHVTGLAAMVAVPAGLLYWLCSKMSGANLKEGEKPGFGRKLLKWTGFAFLGALGVRALAPWVSEKQKALSTPPEKSKDTQRSPYDEAPEYDISGKKVRLWREGDANKISVGTKKFSVNVPGSTELGGKITGMEYKPGKGLVISGTQLWVFSGERIIPDARCIAMVSTLESAKGPIKEDVTLPGAGKNDPPEKYTLEFSPENIS